MIKNHKLSIIAIIFLILIIFLIPTYSMAIGNPIDNPGAYNPGTSNAGDTTAIISKGNKILGVITVVGVVAAVITLIILGIKYMFGSVEEKAEYKKSMIPYFIGVALLVSISAIVALIAQLTKETLS